MRGIYSFLYGLLIGLLAGGVLLVAARRPPGRPVELPPPPTPRPLRVHVAGAVQAPGLYLLPPGSVWQDALAAAGGPASGADPGQVNLAQLLADGDQVEMPAVQPTVTRPRPTSTPRVSVSPTAGSASIPPQAGEPTATPPPPGSSLVNINTATVEQLDTLPGIGPAIAQRVVDYRVANGPFQKLDDLMRVRGIGTATFDKIRDLITLGP